VNDIALRTTGLGKMYHIGAERERYRTLRDTMVHAAKRPVERIRHPGAATHVSESIWALRDVNLQVKHGDVLGIIGRNGAGKSTLLKVLSRITEPTEGRVEIRGRVGSLLEVGTGFHLELTGRENIFDEIVEFSEIGRFLDTPVKRYSSGMYVRLAFAVAAFLEPDVLLVDEVLAVGDMGFQEKCISRMSEVGVSGRTVLFVSHNMAAVRTLCTRAILLDGGRVECEGPAADVIDVYARTSGRATSALKWTLEDAPGDVHCKLLQLEARQDGHPVVGQGSTSKAVEIYVRFAVQEPSRKLQVGFELMTPDGQCLFQSFHADNPEHEVLVPGEYEITCEIEPGVLNAGSYVASPIAALYFTEWLIRRAPGTELRFGMMLDHPRSSHWTSPREGLLAPYLSWRVRVCQSSTSNIRGGRPEFDAGTDSREG
jgi:lipopolysaccharide transport system ATP-binding protein